MEQTLLNHLFTFVAPSGSSYTIREQNGEDDDILSNPTTGKNLLNLSYFIASIVVDQNFYPKKGKLSVEDALKLPSNDRYAILLNSRIHSIGNILEFNHDWEDKGGIIGYELDLEEFVFNKSIEDISEEELKLKPEAIPLYPNKEFRDIPFNVGTKELLFDVLTGESEQYMIELPLDKRTKNQELIARNLRLEINGKYERVTNFRSFSVKEMNAIRKHIMSLDPIFSGNTKINNPNTNESTYVNILSLPDFFWPEGIG